MGQEIVYCSHCQKRILGSEFESGQAFEVGNLITCSSCAVHVLEGLPAREKELLLAKMFKATKGRHEASAKKTSTASIPIRKAPAHPRPVPSSSTGLVVGIVAGLVVLVALLAVVLGRGGPAPQKPPETRAVPPALPPAVDTARPRLAGEKIDGARRFAQSRPADLDGAVAQWKEAVLAAAGTPRLEEAEREYGAAVVRRKNALVRELADLDEKARALLGAQKFGPCLALYESALGRRAAGDWTAPVKEKLMAVEAAMGKELERAKGQAAQARGRRQEAEVASIRGRVAQWESPKGLTEFDAALAKVPVPPPPPPPRISAEPGLVGSWSFDERTGTTAADASGKGHTAKVVGAAWVDGRVGGAVQVDGVKGYVELPNSPVLDALQEGSFTITVWFRADQAGAAGLVVKGGYSVGLAVGPGANFTLSHWLAGTPQPKWSGLGTRSFPGSGFRHLAGVVDRGTGTYQLYVDGRQEDAKPWDKTVPSHDSGTHTWRVGLVDPPREDFKGTFDEVRLYDRALTAAEIEALARPK